MADTDILQVIAEARVDARSLSEFVFKPADFMVTRRLAPPINTLEYYLNHFRNVEAEGNSAITRANNVISAAQANANTAINNIIIDGNAQISNAISNAGFVQVGTFAAGATLAKRNDAIQASDGKLYRWGGSLPKTVTASSTPASSGGFGSNAWVEVSDASLSQKLSGLGGASFIKNGVSVFDDLASFNAAANKVQKSTKVYLQRVYQDGDLEGDGRVYNYSTTEVAGAVNITVSGGFLTRPYDRYIFGAEFGCVPDGVVTKPAVHNSDSLQKAFDLIRQYDSSGALNTLSMGNACQYTIGLDNEDIVAGALAGRIYANVSNLHWKFNKSTIDLSNFRIAWHPTSKSYGNYKNITITDAIYKGDASKINATIASPYKVMQQDFIYVDGLTVRGCVFIEANALGHVIDAMGCRDVTIEENKFLGGATTGYRDSAELIQISRFINTNNAGVPAKTSLSAFTSSELFPDNIIYRKNIVKPYLNPITGLTSHGGRPIGDHAYSNIGNFTVEDNYIESPTPFHGSGNIEYRYMFYMSGAGNFAFKRNTIIADGSYAKVLYVHSFLEKTEPLGVKAIYDVSDNIITLKNSPQVIGFTGEIEANKDTPFYFKIYQSGSTGGLSEHGATLNIVNNDIRVDATNEAGNELAYLIYLDVTAENTDYNILGNKLVVTGGAFDSHIAAGRGVSSGYKFANSALNINGNTFKGLSNSFALQKDENYNATAGEGLIVNLNNNTFVEQWLIANITDRGAITFTNNKIVGHSPLSYGGTAATGSTIRLKGSSVYLASNVMTGDDRANPYSINGATTLLQDWEFKVL